MTEETKNQSVIQSVGRLFLHSAKAVKLHGFKERKVQNFIIKNFLLYRKKTHKYYHTPKQLPSLSGGGTLKRAQRGQQNSTSFLCVPKENNKILIKYSYDEETMTMKCSKNALQVPCKARLSSQQRIKEQTAIIIWWKE